MSDTLPNEIREELALLPNQVITHPRFNVRPFSSESEMEDREVEHLAESIEAVGQLDAVLITPEKVLIAGHRRRRAIIIINGRRSSIGASLLRIRCAVDRSSGDLRQKAIVSNLQRKETSPMDLAYLITQIRKEHTWIGSAGTQQVADYLGVSCASVFQHEKLLCLEKELQNKVHGRVISAQSAFDLLKLPTSEERAKAIERASEIQSEDRLDKALDDHKTGKRSHDETIKTINQAPRTRIEHPAIVKAIRERHVTTITKHPKISLTRTELITAIAQFDTEIYPEQLRSFAHYFVAVFAQGLGSADELRIKFIAMTQGPEPKSKPVQNARTLVS